MAKFENNGIIEFDEKDFKAAWDNAPKLINKDENQFRMCFICKFHMEFKDKLKGKMPWNIEIINLNNIELINENFIAIHDGCKELRPKSNCTKIIKKIKSVSWKFDENFYK
ncbi:hypothetical protein SLITO_v1c08810 [Spiroplasma litorale]|uniref:Uncharacterized protein n=1 Tax=Spiroplasma litorale TaxID=216942 RepID=A0A0K1W2U1_9MOLU|nr:hypothetical protein [Spiroplasma litorale]AKX34496.1 hypothetical protein SLITO_v1c08810 [Spiroplasma litorale]